MHFNSIMQWLFSWIKAIKSAIIPQSDLRNIIRVGGGEVPFLLRTILRTSCGCKTTMTTRKNKKKENRTALPELNSTQNNFFLNNKNLCLICTLEFDKFSKKSSISEDKMFSVCAFWKCLVRWVLLLSTTQYPFVCIHILM